MLHEPVTSSNVLGMMVALWGRKLFLYKTIIMQTNKPGTSSPDAIRTIIEHRVHWGKSLKAIIVPLMQLINTAETMSQQSPFSTAGRGTQTHIV
eukprot:bmy_00805T0